MSIKINNKSLQKAQINGKEVQKIVINGNTVYTKAAPIEYIGYQLGTNGTTSTTQTTTATVTFNKAKGNGSQLLNNSQDALILCGHLNMNLATNITANTSGITVAASGIANYIKKVSGFQNNGSTDYSQVYNVTVSSNQTTKGFGGQLLAFNKINKITVKNNIVEAYKSNWYAASSYTNNVKNGELLIVMGRIASDSTINHAITITNGTVLKNMSYAVFGYQGSTISGAQSYDIIAVVQGDGSNITVQVPDRRQTNLHIMILS